MANKRRLLDLFCGAGGAALGYQRAGFEVIGIDSKPQPNYPGTFYRMDVLDLTVHYLRGFDVVHASPPCQLHSHGTVAKDRSKYPNLIPPTRQMLLASGRPYVIENVLRAPLIVPITLCGASFNLEALDDDGMMLYLKRHRLFESNLDLTGPPCECATPRALGWKVGGVYGGGRTDRWEAENIRHGGYCPPFHVQSTLMGITHMTQKELRQAIPPAYTQHLGYQIQAELDGREWGL